MTDKIEVSASGLEETLEQIRGFLYDAQISRLKLNDEIVSAKFENIHRKISCAKRCKKLQNHCAKQLN